MAAVTRQPFAPLDGARLQSLTSLKNRQNAVAPPSSGKRKAELLDVDDDSENVDPVLFAKRSKGTTTASPLKDALLKPASSFVLTRAAAPSTPAASASTSARLPLKHSSTPRRTLQPKSPAARLNTAIAKSSPVSAPAGRSPTRGKRSGILSSRRRSGPYARVDPPSFSLGNPSSAAPFSLDAALKGTLSSYGPPAASASSARVAKPAARPSSSLLDEPEAKASWFFDIHEDTPEQEMTNLLQHSTCVLDISSDEESERKASRERDEGRDKENVPPPDDVSQTRSAGAGTRQATRPLCADDMVVEKERVALGEMNAVDFYADGCDESSVVLVHEDEEQEPPSQNFAFAPELKALSADADAATDETEAETDFVEGDAVTEVAALMDATTKGSSKAAVLQPMDGTGESFELWESGSAKDDGEGEATVIAAS
ncbi:thymidylate kinase [Purpureocillium lilacinum]|uniref:Thymidylate kinase n=1 Tax=Purpureocillium lilacinum TaxID=33203 RepID=A0A179GDM6_PURLI|nr:thymidylate kinase [Purpureocillium lilacinum]OAQ75924.1 thymidylate kinase [Purpureocillium lilacinum]